MSFQTIYRMLAEGTELGIHIKRVENRLCVAVMPKREKLKNESGQSIIPLVLNGTPEELDAEFLSAIARPMEKVQGILMNLEAFEKQAEKAAAESKAAQPAAKKETKEERERREKLEKLLKKADESVAARQYSNALIWLRQAERLAPAERLAEIKRKIEEVQRKNDEGSLFASMPEPNPTVLNPSAVPNTGNFDKDDEDDRELLKEDPYAEYIDFPEENRMKDEAQLELVCC